MLLVIFSVLVGLAVLGAIAYLLEKFPVAMPLVALAVGVLSIYFVIGYFVTQGIVFLFKALGVL